MPTTACVTGATGMVGVPIVRRLLAAGHTVRVLTRRRDAIPGVQVYRGDLSDLDVLDRFVGGADMVFHCAGELRDASRMQQVNVEGTRHVTALIRKHGVRFFCHMSSAGVVGSTSVEWVDETSPCRPQDEYERSKLAAEELARVPIDGCCSVVLRPTNVVDAERLGELALPIEGSLSSWAKAVIKGGECAHIVHAEDVARAALHFAGRKASGQAEVYFVSLDHDPENTVAALWALYRAGRQGRQDRPVPAIPHVPPIVPHLLRRIVRQAGNRGSVRYSSRRLMAEGFRFSLDVSAIVARVLDEHGRHRVSCAPAAKV